MATEARTQSVAAITSGQIGQICDRLTTRFRKSELLAEHVQTVLSAPGGACISEMFNVFCEWIGIISSFIVRRAPVRRDRSLRKCLRATGYELCVEDEVMATAPRGEGTEAEVVFFKLLTEEHSQSGLVSDRDLKKAYARRGLKAAPLDDVAAIIETNPTFAHDKQIATHWNWENVERLWCHAYFYRWCGKRRVFVRKADSDVWQGHHWSFAGVRK